MKEYGARKRPCSQALAELNTYEGAWMFTHTKRVPQGGTEDDSPAFQRWGGVENEPESRRDDTKRAGFSPPEQQDELPGSKEQLRFEVKNQSYMLSFNRDDGRWYLVTSGLGGRMKAIPVINDDEVGFVPNMVIPVGDTGQAGVN